MDHNWGNDEGNFKTWNIENDNIEYTAKIEEAKIALIPFAINQYYIKKEMNKLELLSAMCSENKLNAYGFIERDFGKHYGEIGHIIYLRPSGFRSKLTFSNQGIPVFLDDHYKKFFNSSEIIQREKKEKPKVGFCGHASFSKRKRIKEDVKVVLENCKRIVKGDFDLEPFFPSAYHRAKLLNLLKVNGTIETNFIFRSGYRGGAQTEEQKKTTTLEYYQNVVDSDYIFCLRGAGNFSVRFYETLMCGRIPLFINTDCLLPQSDKIDWKKHVVWVEWDDRKYIAERILDFHNDIHPDDFIALQSSNRELWKNKLSVSGSLKYLVTQ